MILDEAMKAHAEWKIKFRMAIAHHDKMDETSISHDTGCNLGRWLHTEALNAYSKLPELHAVVDKHKYFHREAGRVAALINSGRYADAEKAIGPGTAYATASSEVAVAILALKKVTGLN